MNGQAQTYINHDCKDYAQEVWHNNKEYNYTKCGVCGTITRFRWKKTWKHLWMTFWDRIGSSKYF